MVYLLEAKYLYQALIVIMHNMALEQGQEACEHCLVKGCLEFLIESYWTPVLFSNIKEDLITC